jgi:tRNA(Ile)-lysidine synthase
VKPFLHTQLIPKHARIVVAVSGGIDSMVLLHQLIAIQDSKKCTLIVAHVDHQKRPTSSQDAMFVSEYAKSHGLDVHIIQLHLKNSGNFHQEARNERYRFFMDVCKQYHATHVALAHQLDDQAETVLMRFVRGSTLRGYAGMEESVDLQGIFIIRPILHASRKEIEAYQQYHHVPFVEDETNRQSDYTRNRYRHQIVPLLERENPKWNEKAAQAATYFKEAADFFEEEASIYLLQHTVSTSTAIEFSTTTFQKLSIPVKRMVLNLLINQLSNNTFESNFSLSNQMMSICESAKPNLQMALSKKYLFEKNYQLIRIRETQIHSTIEVITISWVGEYVLPDGNMLIISHQPILSNGIKFILWYNELSQIFPITLRPRQDGDKMTFSYGSKKIKDLFIDKKVNLRKRNQLYLMQIATKDIVWVPQEQIASSLTLGNIPLYMSYHLKG